MKRSITMADIVIIGCGVIGAATAFYLSRYDLDIVVVEKENDVAMGTSRANSAIIHAGYDPEPGTLAAKLNVEGSRLAEHLAPELSVPYIRNGSLVLAFDGEDEKTLQRLKNNADKNGVEGARIISKEELREKEPNVSPDAVSALYAPTGAIINPWEYTLAFIEVAVKNGVKLERRTEVFGIEKDTDGYLVKTNNGEIKTKYIINCAGTHADEIHAFVAPATFKMTPAKGEYYLLDKSAGDTVSHTVFQCPKAEGKGVLVTPTVHGNLLVGPDALPSGKDDTSTVAEGLLSVKERAKKSVPSVDFRSSIRNFAGVRANTDKNDFIIDFAAENFLDIAGIRSPGLSAAPAVALYAIKKLRKNGLVLYEKEKFASTRRVFRFSELSAEEKNEKIKEDPLYGKIVCRCEKITEGEIRDCFCSKVPPVSVDGVKRRVNAGMGRCQGGFCSPRVVAIIAEELGIKTEDVVKDRDGSYILAKGGGNL